ncbi:uncharacterized protein LOC144127829 [Amblyomma americanum]
MKAYKALESHNYFTSGCVKHLSAKEFQDGKVVLLGEVNHSQRLGHKPLQVWILCKKDGAVITAHCTCMAGAGEACSHVGACLFAVETGIKMMKSRSCTQKDNMWLPAYVEKVQYKRLKDINFTSSKGKKRRLDSNSFEAGPVKERAHVPPLSEQERTKLYGSIQDAGIVLSIFSVLPGYDGHFQNPVPMHDARLRNLYSEEMLAHDLDVLVKKANDVMPSIIISEEIVKAVEALTGQQSSSSNWFLYRAGRVTASVMKRVCHTSIDNPSISLLKLICYPEKQSLKTPAITWGVKNEPRAFRAYQTSEAEKHDMFKCSKSGLHLSTRYPFVGATPDGLVCCACCGKGVVELKCPFSLREVDVTEMATAGSCLETVNGVVQLRRQHGYFYQVQTQMAVCDVQWCDFVVWTPNLLHVERIQKDRHFCEEILAAGRKFFIHAILPELFSTYFTRQHAGPVVDSPSDVYCFCRGPETGKMVACDNASCHYKWFHFSCVALKRAPKTTLWFCPECKGPKG